MAPMTSDLSGFITTLTFSRKAYTYTHTHTHAYAHAPAHTRTPLCLDGFSNAIDLIDSKGLLFHDQRLAHFAHGFTAQRKPQNIHSDDGVK